MATIYNELMKVKIDINDMQRNAADVHNTLHYMGNDVSDLKIFKNVYRSDIIDATVGVTTAHQRINELNSGLAIVDTKLNDFIKTFNGWADLIKELKADVAALKKENAELRPKSSAKSVTSTTAVVAPSTKSSAKSVTSTTAVIGPPSNKK